MLKRFFLVIPVLMILFVAIYTRYNEEYVLYSPVFFILYFIFVYAVLRNTIKTGFISYDVFFTNHKDNFLNELKSRRNIKFVCIFLVISLFIIISLAPLVTAHGGKVGGFIILGILILLLAITCLLLAYRLIVWWRARSR